MGGGKRGVGAPSGPKQDLGKGGGALRSPFFQVKHRTANQLQRTRTGPSKKGELGQGKEDVGMGVVVRSEEVIEGEGGRKEREWREEERGGGERGGTPTCSQVTV